MEKIYICKSFSFTQVLVLVLVLVGRDHMFQPSHLRASLVLSGSGLLFQLQFPLPEFIVAMGFFLVLVLEQIVLAFKDQSPPQLEERRALMADSGAQAAGGGGGLGQRRRGSAEPAGPLHAAPGSQSALRAFVLVFSLSLHSVLEGLAVGLLQRGQEVLQVCLALLIHKSVIAFSLSAALSQGRLRRAVVSGCLLAFAVMSPLGIALGVGLTESRMSPQHRLARCTLQGLAAGTFLYITFMEILPHELAAGRGRIPKVAMMLLGFAAVTGVLFIKV
ncbi:hypothetical protein CCH79_00020788 [Gambusia affinis]|uniref:Zinc/iron permease n=1 Tax=Gambusia affinis TaxID=33528 RepID=A0A315URX1_GAMAF|nr:hypothetical protein CCH79_00020788 [Gambusia affinis]